MATAVLNLSQQPTLAQQVHELTIHLPKLPTGKRAFAMSLINQFSPKGTLSPKQIPYVAELLALATGKQPAAPQSIAVGDLSGLIGLFKSAKPKYPKITLEIDKTPIVLSLLGERSKTPGSVNLKGEGRNWKEAPWYGRISPDGKFQPSRQLTPALRAALVPVLEHLAVDAVAAVRQYGKLTGNCMFCGDKLGARPGMPETLTTRRSVAAGMGETCATNWGMHEQWKQAAK